MIRYIVGVPGSGKTLYALRRIEEELVYSDRWVVTNLTEIRWPEFQAYLLRTYPTKAIDLRKRLQIIDKKETRTFYRW